PPDQEAENRYKLNRYRWSHKLGDDYQPTKEEAEKILSNLKHTEVAPDYFTYVEEGRAEKMKTEAPFFLFHSLMGEHKNLVKMIKTGAYISTHERYQRGMNISGCSSNSDIQTGGADGVFLRMWANRPGREEGTMSRDTVTLIFNSDILNRTDYYCYPADQYGRTTKPVFDSRLTAEELLKKQIKEAHCESNELIFRHGVSTKDIKIIAVNSAETKHRLVDMFEESGVKEINGKTVEEFIMVWDARPISVLNEIDPELKKKVEETRLEKEKKEDEEIARFKVGDTVVIPKGLAYPPFPKGSFAKVVGISGKNIAGLSDKKIITVEKTDEPDKGIQHGFHYSYLSKDLSFGVKSEEKIKESNDGDYKMIDWNKIASTKVADNDSFKFKKFESQPKYEMSYDQMGGKWTGYESPKKKYSNEDHKKLLETIKKIFNQPKAAETHKKTETSKEIKYKSPEFYNNLFLGGLEENESSVSPKTNKESLSILEKSNKLEEGDIVIGSNVNSNSVAGFGIKCRIKKIYSNTEMDIEVASGPDKGALVSVNPKDFNLLSKKKSNK
ncbi:MAG: hypothetical protein HY226_05485, partial [Candidatus Vogelbacteria bacterium]|nr:hypothetical protein [Candidatus Vogelbacteria bacterium]